MNKTRIEYLDYTTNPIVGCSGVGCAVRKQCWAMAMAKRQRNRCELCYAFVPHVHLERFTEPFNLKKPSRIGVAFMGEFYDKKIAETFRKQIYNVISSCFRHTFIVFTKQPQNIDLDEPLPKNLQIGVSVNCKNDLWRINTLREVETSCRIVSAEPLCEDLGEVKLEGIGWLIIGAQTRPNLQPEPEWVYSLSHQASELGIPVFWKDNLTVVYGQRTEFPKP